MYQLNSRSFPHLTEQEFFDPQINIPTGLAYLRYCLDAAGNEVAGLAMYNAGRRRVTTTGAPKMTLDYISKILEYAGTLHNEFNNEMNLTRLSTGYRDDGSSYMSVSYVLEAEDRLR